MLNTLFEIFIRTHGAFASSHDTIIGGSGIGDLPNPLGVNSVTLVLDRIAGYLVTISIPLFAIMIIVGAFQILFATGEPEKIRTGKRTILYAIIGFAIILSATGIVLVIKQLIGADTSSSFVPYGSDASPTLTESPYIPPDTPYDTPPDLPPAFEAP